MIELNSSDINRFWRVTNRGDLKSCWLWGASLFTCGYGRFFLKGKREYAHRIAWVIANGNIPEALNVLHKCDNPRCVNPNHLFLGTHNDNMKDMAAKGRGNGPKRVTCWRGHSDWIYGTDGNRDCRICKAERDKRYHSKVKANLVIN